MLHEVSVLVLTFFYSLRAVLHYGRQSTYRILADPEFADGFVNLSLYILSILSINSKSIDISLFIDIFTSYFKREFLRQIL